MLGAIAFSIYLAKIPGMSALTLIEPFKINLPIVAAFLTIIGYSVNDTIVVFDRIREVRGKDPRLRSCWWSAFCTPLAARRSTGSPSP